MSASGKQTSSSQGISRSEDKEKHVLIGCTGSVAAIKLPVLVQELQSIGNVEVRVLVTENALKFFDKSMLPSGVRIYRDQDEWQMWNKLSDPVLHIELRRWADLMVIAPLDANTLGKVSSGICDNLLTCVVRAWDVSRPLLFCPAMNTHMWQHPITAGQVAELSSWGYKEIPCIEKLLACGDKGFGAMAEVSTIVEGVKEALT
ncbi:phosphopantothenoylcysteine decarboxylase-like [Diadema antillarum]|uniref:phosphopantothenoylcysteine decarboxylase-like n=1 Tax=Diadema antillarum TaxID=105358 RepID=UPI003A85E9CE